MQIYSAGRLRVREEPSLTHVYKLFIFNLKILYEVNIF